ncbi:MAG: ABC transporter substrate-binding protein [Clostridia bacterium]|nr:ABC transporter substrate-binding protein [Clostridia bacterium]
MKKTLSLIIIALMTLTLLTACQKSGNDEVTTTTPSGEVVLDKELEIRVSVLSGTTGMGIAPLIKSANEGKEPLNYKFDIQSDATLIAPGIIGGKVDIAAVPTNLAATLYNKTNGGIKLLAANTKGVLYIVSKDTAVDSIDDLKGKTVHVPGAGTNPEYLLKYVLTAAGLEVGKDVTLDYTYQSPDALTAALASSTDVSYALLPEPKVSAAQGQVSDLKAVINLTTEWNKVSQGYELYQGCVIVRKAFLDEHPNEVAEFLRAYKASIESVTADPAAASEIIAEVGIIPKAALAKKAIPNCNLCYDDSQKMKDSVLKLFRILHDLEKSSVGGKVPAADIFAD